MRCRPRWVCGLHTYAHPCANTVDVHSKIHSHAPRIGACCSVLGTLCMHAHQPTYLAVSGCLCVYMCECVCLQVHFLCVCLCVCTHLHKQKRGSGSSACLQWPSDPMELQLSGWSGCGTLPSRIANYHTLYPLEEVGACCVLQRKGVGGIGNMYLLQACDLYCGVLKQMVRQQHIQSTGGKASEGSRNLSLWCPQPQVQGLWLDPCTSNQGPECCTHPQHTCLGICKGSMVIGLQRPCRAWPTEAWGISWRGANAP